MTVTKAIGYSIALSFILIYVTPALQEPAGAAMLEVASKRFSAGYIPVIGSYVEYEVALSNLGQEVIKDQSLHVMLVSDSNKTLSVASYSVRELSPGERRVLYLGPFKIEDIGRHHLLAEMEGVSLQYEQDSFTSYGQEAVQTIIIAVPLVAAGAGVAGFSLYKKRKAV